MTEWKTLLYSKPWCMCIWPPATRIGDKLQFMTGCKWFIYNLWRAVVGDGDDFGFLHPYSAIDRAQVALVSHRNHLQAGGGKSRTAGDPPPNLQLIMIILYWSLLCGWTYRRSGPSMLRCIRRYILYIYLIQLVGLLYTWSQTRKPAGKMENSRLGMIMTKFGHDVYVLPILKAGETGYDIMTQRYWQKDMSTARWRLGIPYLSRWGWPVGIPV